MFVRVLTCSVLAAGLLGGGMIEKPAVAQDVTQPLVRITDIEVDSVVVRSGQLVANAIVTLDVLGREITQEVPIPLTLDGTAAEPCDILNLSLGPVHLDLLGLVVNLDDCDGGPVTVDIMGVPGQLLGDLLCGIAGLLNGGIDLSAILDDLPADVLDDLLVGIEDVLNEVLDAVLNTGTPVAAIHQQQGGGGHACDILTLEVPDGLSLNVLGLLVETSPICLDVHAERGGGNLLGNLLCNLVGLLDTPANNNALRAHVRNILRLLDRLGL
jgi:hypothetical protein